MDDGVTVERSFRAPRDLVWALLADTNRYDRSLGLSRARYSYREVDGVRRMIGEARQGGLSMSWYELPYQWVEGRYLEGKRHFLTGPARVGGLRIEIEEEDGGCRGRMTAFGEARSLALKMLSPLVTAGLRRRMRAYLDDVERAVADEALVARMCDSTGRVPSVERVQDLLRRGDTGPAEVIEINTGELQRRRARLDSAPVDAQIVERLVEQLRSRPDDEVAQMRPFELARTWSCDRRGVLRAFLYATHAGLVDLSWQINCPVCRVSAAVARTLADVGREVHCDECNIRYAIAFGDNVEAVFRCNAALRAVEPAVYCASSPTFRPHVLAQLSLDPGESRRELIDLRCGHVRARTLSTQAPREWKGECAPAELTIEISGEAVTMRAEGRSEDGITRVQLQSSSSNHEHVVLERAGWAADAVLGSVIASMAEFMDLFATEAPAAGLELSIGRLTLLFSDLTSSTALYSSIGDARAFAIVQEHFALLQRAVSDNDGAVVKTMGDAVMATFPSLSAAVRAALQAIESTAEVHGKLEIGVKLGVYEGACLAVRANDRLDFFGTTVNVAARLQGQARSGELVLMEADLQRADIAELSEGRPRRTFDAELKGIEGRQRLVAISTGLDA